MAMRVYLSSFAVGNASCVRVHASPSRMHAAKFLVQKEQAHERRLDLELPAGTVHKTKPHRVTRSGVHRHHLDFGRDNQDGKRSFDIYSTLPNRFPPTDCV